MEVHVMLRKNIVQTLDAATSWKVFGLDLAKHDLAVVAIPADGSEVQYVKRYSYADFLEFTAQIPSATMVFEPGNGANHFALRLQAQGHTPKMVSQVRNCNPCISHYHAIKLETW